MLPSLLSCLPSSAFLSDYRSGANRARRVSEYLAEFRDGRGRYRIWIDLIGSIGSIWIDLFLGVHTREILETVHTGPLAYSDTG